MDFAYFQLIVIKDSTQLPRMVIRWQTFIRIWLPSNEFTLSTGTGKTLVRVAWGESSQNLRWTHAWVQIIGQRKRCRPFLVRRRLMDTSKCHCGMRRRVWIRCLIFTINEWDGCHHILPEAVRWEHAGEHCGSGKSERTTWRISCAWRWWAARNQLGKPQIAAERILLNIRPLFNSDAISAIHAKIALKDLSGVR